MFVLVAALMALGGRREPPPMVVITALAMAVSLCVAAQPDGQAGVAPAVLPAGLVVIAGLFLFLLSGKAVEKAFSVVTTVASRGMSVAIGNAAPPPLPGLGPASGTPTHCGR